MSIFEKYGAFKNSISEFATLVRSLLHTLVKECHSSNQFKFSFRRCSKVKCTLLLLSSHSAVDNALEVPEIANLILPGNYLFFLR